MTASQLRTLLLAMAVGISALVACSERTPRFSHEYHLTRLACGGPGQPQCLNCTSCHKVDKSNHVLPRVTACQGCHKPADKHKLAAVHPPPDDDLEFAESLHFSHALHLKMPALAGQCVPCHAGVVPPSDNPLASVFPPMQRCFKCHEHQQQWDQAKCSACHERKAMSQVMPQSFLPHNQGWMRHHGTLAREKRQVCSQCHSQQQCNDCHDVTQNLKIEDRQPDAVERHFVHRGNWLSVHPIEAKSQPRRCLSCHTQESCDGCHVRRGVSANAVRGANPHPQGWVGGDPNNPNFHGRAARRDILTCAGCHDQGPATNCIRCHKVGGPGGNPHPHGWKSARSDNASMCRYCHGG